LFETQIETKENEMSYKLVFIINAIVVFVFGLVLFIVPTVGLQQFNMDARATDVFMTRVIGAALASLGLLLWFCQNADEDVQRWLGIAALAGAVLGLIVTLLGVGGGVVRQNGWIVILVELLFALAYAFLVFLQPRMQQ
jgi:cell division protein FtsW (lipid II flippase)